MIFLGADHNGIVLKNRLLAFLKKRGVAFVDLSPVRRVPTDDYPPIARRVVAAVRRKKGSFGVLVCGSGNGMVMAANRFPDIRAALAPSPAYARKAREDENANIIVLPAWWLTTRGATRTLHQWLTTAFSKEPRHRRRIRQLSTRNG